MTTDRPHIFLPATKNLDLVHAREDIAADQGLSIITWFSVSSNEIFQRVDADDEAALSFFLLTMPGGMP